MKTLAPLAALAAAVFTIGCITRPASSIANEAPARGAQAPTSIVAANGDVETPHFAWPGTYDILGDNFPEGLRTAIMTVTARDSSYDFFIVGPPGVLRESKVSGDSAHVIWDMFGEPMYVDVRGVADSLDGRWRIGDQSGHVWGTRRK